MTKKEIENLTDRQLIDCLIVGDNQVVKYLFYDKCSKMFGYIVKEVFNYKIYKDELVNEFFIYLQENNWSRVKTFDYRSRFTTWLSVVALRYFQNSYDRMIDHPLHTPLYKEKFNQRVSYIPEHEISQKVDLYKAIAQMKNPRDRFVLSAMDLNGREVAEVAETLGVTVANLYNIKLRARRQLATLLAEYRYDN